MLKATYLVDASTNLGVGMAATTLAADASVDSSDLEKSLQEQWQQVNSTEKSAAASVLASAGIAYCKFLRPECGHRWTQDR